MQPGGGRDRMEVGFHGTRGSISTPGRVTEKYGGNTPCISVRCQDTVVIFDAGTGVRNLGIELAERHRQDGEDMTLHLFLSHTHWDHIQGIPFFAPAYMPGVRLIIHGSPSKRGFFEQILRGQMDANYFPVDMAGLAADLTIREMDEDVLEIGPLTIDWEEQEYHPGGSVRYRVWLDNRRVVYATDIELNKFFVPSPTTEQRAAQDRYLNFIQYADLLIADGQYTPEDYEKFKGFGHSSIDLVADIAYQARVKSLAIFHHDPSRTDNAIDQLWNEYRPKYQTMRPPMNVFWAREGQVLPV